MTLSTSGIGTSLAERIEIGLFTAELGGDAFDESNVILMQRHPIRSYNFYIDRNAADNVLLR